MHPDQRLRGVERNRDQTRPEPSRNQHRPFNTVRIECFQPTISKHSVANQAPFA
ncbi:UNVERIFIED_ORG: hypothetical protein QOE_0042 [Clostridioides difficile F501]